MKYFLEVDVEIKGEHGGVDNTPPSSQEVAAYAYQALRETVRPEYEINWMPTRITPVTATGREVV